MADQTETLLSIDEAAAAIGVSRRTLYNLMDRGDVQYVRIGARRKITQTEVDRVRGGA